MEGSIDVFSRSSTAYSTKVNQLFSLGGDLSSTDIFFCRFDAPFGRICIAGIRGNVFMGQGGFLMYAKSTSSPVA